ncbi:MAG TPA: RidA family protein [Candidatus Limnocylindrales bacterium]|nr:RidA family protein [Candidatus Limnocylindrales bacterium]
MPIQRLSPEGMFKPGHYSQVVAAAGAITLYISGQVSVDAQGKLVAADDLPGQARQVYENLRLALEAAGATPADVTKITTYVVGYRTEYLAALTEARITVLGSDLPASTLIGVQTLAQPGFLVEVEATAVID